VLRLTGQVTVRFVAGHSLTGKFAAQDQWNIFLLVDNQPVMIPRDQILYLKGEAGQGIERDTSQEDHSGAESDVTDLTDSSLFETADLVSSSSGTPSQTEETLVEPGGSQDRGEGTFGVQPDPAQGTPDVETAAFPPDESEIEDTGQTFVLDEDDEPALEEEAEAVGFVFSDQPVVQPEPTLEDRTVVLDEEEEDEDEITYILETEEESKPSALLICTTGPHAGEQFTLSGERITMGRARDNEVALFRDKEVSRRHAVIKQEAGQFVIQDQNSLNGTFVNSERVQGARPLQDGDIILVGVSDLAFHV
jgi:hypothetical protein